MTQLESDVARYCNTCEVIHWGRCPEDDMTDFTDEDECRESNADLEDKLDWALKNE